MKKIRNVEATTLDAQTRQDFKEYLERNPDENVASVLRKALKNMIAKDKEKKHV